MPDSPPPKADAFLVCGLGSLGQYCVYNLRRFATPGLEVLVTAIEKVPPTDAEVEDLPGLLSREIVYGDCRDDQVLLRAGVREARAVLLVTSNESDNVQAAMAARRLNPQARLVVRCGRANLNELLRQQLGNFVALDPTELPATAFAVAALRTDLVGFFTVEGRRFEVFTQALTRDDRHLVGRSPFDLPQRAERLVSWRPRRATTEAGRAAPFQAFHQWTDETVLRAGDALAWVRHVPPADPQAASDAPTLGEWLRSAVGRLLRPRRLAADARSWLQEHPKGALIATGLTIAAVLWTAATLVLRAYVPGMTWTKATTSAVLLLLGGFGDVFGGLRDEVPVPAWVQGFSLLVTVVSLVYIFGALGVIADSLLNARLQFLRRSPPMPRRDHVVLVGLRRLGRRVAAVLRQFDQPLVAVTDDGQVPPDALPFPVVAGTGTLDAGRTNLATARSLILLTEDEMLNLEVALAARGAAQQAGRELGLVVRAYDQRLSRNLAGLLPGAKVLTAYELSGEAFAAAAFGETIAGLFRLHDHTILVAEYAVADGDSLCSRLVVQIGSGFGVVPVALFRVATSAESSDDLDLVFPPDDVRLRAGDRLTVLASINGLRRIERDQIVPPRRWRATGSPPIVKDFLHFAGNTLSRVAGIPLADARAFMESLPGTMDLDLYDAQARRLVAELRHQMELRLEPIADVVTLTPL